MQPAAPATVDIDSRPVAGSLRADAHSRWVALDVLRGVAACLVIVDHARLTPGLQGTAVTSSFVSFREVEFGEAGVGLFFVISGYLVGGPFVRALVEGSPPPEMRRYALRRAARILPAYWIALVTTSLIELAWTSTPVTWQGFAIHVLLLQNLFPGEALALFLVAWTLGVEALYYIVVPALVTAVRRWHVGAVAPDAASVAIVAIAAVSTLWIVVSTAAYPAGVFYGTGTVFRDGLVPMLVLFCPGMLLAVAAVPEDGRPNGARRAVRAVASHRGPAVAAALVVVVLSWVAYTIDPVTLAQLSRVPLAGASGIVLAVALSAGTWSGPVVRLGAWLGEVSYGLYLWHLAAVALLLRAGLVPRIADNMVGLGPAVALTLAVTLLPAALSWYLVERPALALADRVAVRLRSERRFAPRVGRAQSRALGAALTVVAALAGLGVVSGAAAAVIANHRGGPSQPSPVGTGPLVAVGAATAAQAAASSLATTPASVAGPAEPGLSSAHPAADGAPAFPVPSAQTPSCAPDSLAFSIDPGRPASVAPGQSLEFEVGVTNTAASACALLPAQLHIVTEDSGGEVVVGACPICAGALEATTIPSRGRAVFREAWTATRQVCEASRCASVPLPPGMYTVDVAPGGTFTVPVVAGVAAVSGSPLPAGAAPVG